MMNRQPMGKSSYQCDFLEYGSLPTYNFKHEEGVVNKNFSAVRTSTYQNDFK